ncbi:hypothetical protein F4781DRAFT_354807 [Annulohypoxylon bovei var. microspora]|nr:hypothetical protein F4781DRAFT_354807 [Annulohypoxylon bovei var. microspora]
MLAKQQILVVALLGSAQAAVQFPTCITSCVRQSGCSPTDLDCMCKKSSSGTFLSDAVVCMNQWCDASTKFSDLLGPIQAKCDVPQAAISSAESKAGFDTGSDSDSTPSATSKASATGSGSSSPSVSVIMSVGEPDKIDGSTSAPQVTGSATKASSPSSAVYSDSTAVITQTSGASESLLVAATTLTSAASASSTSTSTSEDSSDDSSSSSSDGSPAGGHTGDSGAATSQASLLAAVLAVGAAMAFGW